jgi:hypothetical protein
VVGGDDRPLTGAEVRFFDRTGEDRRGIGAVCDASGSFRISTGASALGDLVVSHRDHLVRTITGLGPGSEPLRIVLSEGAGIDGVAVVDGVPLADAMLLLRGPGVERLLLTGDQGEFRVRGLPGGDYRLTVAAIAVTAVDASGEARKKPAVPAHEPVTVVVASEQVLETDIGFAFEKEGPRSP